MLRRFCRANFRGISRRFAYYQRCNRWFSNTSIWDNNTTRILAENRELWYQIPDYLKSLPGLKGDEKIGKRIEIQTQLIKKYGQEKPESEQNGKISIS